MAGAVPLGDLIEFNLSITLGDKVFSDFSWGSTVDPDSVNVTAYIAGGVYYIEFNSGALQASDGASTDATLRYKVSVIGSAASIYAIDQRVIAGAQGTGGVVSITEYVYDENGYGVNLIANSTVGRTLTSLDPNDPPAELGDYLDFSDNPQKIVYIEKDLGLDSFVSGSVSATTITQSFHQRVPEPAILLLFGLGLIGLAGASRKFKK
jgi:hypothetical protein